MRALGRLIVVITAALGGMVAAQFPEFSQQYRQRLGGALQELNRVVEEFDADAERNQLTREAALQTYDRSGDPFLRDRRITMMSTLSRFEALLDQKVRLEAVPPLMRPVVVLSRLDGELVQGAWSDFEPSLPITPAGLIWGGIGFFLAGGAVSLVRQIVGAARRRRPQLHA